MRIAANNTFIFKIIFSDDGSFAVLLTWNVIWLEIDV